MAFTPEFNSMFREYDIRGRVSDKELCRQRVQAARCALDRCVIAFEVDTDKRPVL